MALVGLHLAAPRIRRLPFVSAGAVGSFAGGLSLAYVFLHLLPGVAEGSASIGSALSRVIRPTPLLDLAVFFVALVGFTAFYGLERLADRHGDPPLQESVGPAGSGSAAGDVAVYRLHLSSFMIYNALITCTMAPRQRAGVAFAVLFTIAMGLHFVLTDRGLEEHYPRRFRGAGRGALAVALTAGWALNVVLDLSGALLTGLLLWAAVLSGVTAVSE